MFELIKDLNLGQWVTFVIVVAALWRWVFKSLAESWFENQLELQKQQVSIALQIQRDLALKQAEFEKVKLERVLPLLEIINSAVTEHNMIFNTYIHYILNKCGSSEKLEQARLTADERMIGAISAVSIYLPDEFRRLTYRLRMIVSCYTRDPEVTARTLRSFGAGQKIPPLAQDLYVDLIDCFHSMCAKYLGVASADETYIEILAKYNLDDKIETTKKDPENELAYKFLLLHEMFGSSEQVQAQKKVEELYADERDRSA